MKMYGVYKKDTNDHEFNEEIDRYYLDREEALEFIFIQGGHTAHLDDWLVELEVIE